jgi:glucuronokinase
MFTLTRLLGHHIGVKDYNRWIHYFQNKSEACRKIDPIYCRAYARVGLIGNPSDGFHGKTISLSIKNFWADATIFESPQLNLIPHPLNDPTSFGSLADLHGISVKEGYLGGLRLLQATCKKFYEYCDRHGIALPKRNFTLSYDTNIPRQVGLAGSSAIVTATVKCLMKFFNLTDSDMPKPIRASFILDVECNELYIQAGLQDRVIQVYEGLVDMDFNKELLEKQGYGNYTELSLKSLPPFFLAYCPNPSDSGRIHSDVKQKWLNRDKDIIDGMAKFREITTKAREAIETCNWEQLQDLMTDNFEQRRKLYGDHCLGGENLKMVAIARQYGAAAKFSGSGGAVVGLLLDESKKAKLAESFQSNGFVFIDLVPNSPNSDTFDTADEHETFSNSSSQTDTENGTTL